MATQLYANLATQWDATLATGVTQTVQTAIQANAVQLTVAITLWLILSGIATMFQKMTMQEWVFGATRAACLGILLTAAGFATWIQTPLMTTIPNWIAQSINGGFNATTGPHQFDTLRDMMVAREAAIYQQATGWTMIGERLQAWGATMLVCIELTICFGIWEAARCLMGLLVAATPFILFFYLWRPTQHVALNLGGMALSLLILDVLLSTMLSLSINVDLTFANTLATTGGIDILLDNAMMIEMFYLFGLLVTIILPSVAAKIANGFLPSAGGIVTAPGIALGRAARDLSSAARYLRGRVGGGKGGE
jgi:hypothetical protein